MDDFYDNDNYYENEENTETDTEVVTGDTFIKENLNSPGGTDDEKSDTAKPKKSAKRKTSVSAKPKRTGSDKMMALTEQRNKIMEQQNANRRKGKEIDGQLAEVNAKIRNIEIDELEKVCVKLNISFPALTAFLEKLPGGKKLSYSENGNLPPAPAEEKKSEKNMGG